MDEMAREVERQPAFPEQPRLEAVGIRHGDHEHALASQQADRAFELRTGVGQVLQRMPEDDRGPLPPDVVKSDRPQIGPSRLSFQTQRGTSAAPESVEQRTVTRSDVEHGSGRCDPVKSPRELAARAAQDRIAEP